MPTTTRTTCVSTIKRPVRRSVDGQGHITVSGGQWEATMSDGRQFVHASKVIVTRMAAIYRRGGEDAIASTVLRGHFQ
jgi:hypothetical protein